MPHFTHYAAVDWSGASGERHKGIAVAIIGAADPAPTLVRPGHVWSRIEVLHWLLDETPPDTLIGFDLGQSLAYTDRGAFFPGWADSPETARELWALVDSIALMNHIWASPPSSTTRRRAAISAAMACARAICSARRACPAGAGACG
jgi:hypothetical protein